MNPFSSASASRAKPATLCLAFVFASMSLATPSSAFADPAGFWEGSYSCLQGQTALALRVIPIDGAHFNGIFHFHASAQNPLVPDGCYTMHGELAGDSHQLIFVPGEWIQRPANYVMVGLAGTVAGETYTGQITGGFNCTAFQLFRVKDEAAMADSCGQLVD